MSTAEDLINTSVESRTGVIELARPKVLNCLSMEVFARITEALDRFEADENINSLCIRAQGKHFCTGAELPEVRQVQKDAEDLARFLEIGHSTLRRLERSRLITVAQVQGLCLAGGLELMLACDRVFAAKSAKFGDQHGQFGLVPGWGGSQRLPRIVGLRRALDLFLSVRWIEADEAQAWGLVTEVVEDGGLAAAVSAFCSTLGTRSAEGLALMKRLARDGLDMTLDEGLAFEQRAAAPVLMSPDVHEGISAFEEKRTPVFRR